MPARLGLAPAPALLLALALAAPADAQGPAARYEKGHTISLGGEGGWDFIEVEPQSRRLYVTRGNRVVVVDLDTETVAGEIADTPGVHGVAFVPGLSRGFTSNGGDSSVTAFDTRTLKTLGKVKANGRPDIIYYEPASRRVLTFNHGTNDCTAIDPEAMTNVGTLALGGVPELAASDDKGHVFVNLEDTSEVVEFDARTLEILKRFPLAPGAEPTGLAFDAKARRLFSTCANRTLVVSDADSGKVVQTLEIGPGPDGCLFDAEAGLVFSSNGGDGTLTVIREAPAAPGRYEVVANIKTQVGAKTMAMDPKTRRIYLSAATVAPAAPAEPGKKAARRSYVPGSFVVVVRGE